MVLHEGFFYRSLGRWGFIRAHCLKEMSKWVSLSKRRTFDMVPLSHRAVSRAAALTWGAFRRPESVWGLAEQPREPATCHSAWELASMTQKRVCVCLYICSLPVSLHRKGWDSQWPVAKVTPKSGLLQVILRFALRVWNHFNAKTN